MNLSLAILNSLQHTGAGVMMPRFTLLADLRINGRTETVAEFSAAVRDLEGRAEIIGISSPDAAGGYRYQITDAGKARLAESNLLL